MRTNFFDPDRFRAMLNTPAERANFAATFPTAGRLFEEYVELTTPALPDFPAGGATAIQLTAFDNGQQCRTKTTKSRFGLTVKVWDRTEIDWGKDHQIAWEASVALGSAVRALEIARSLEAKNLLLPGVQRSLDWLVSTSDGDGLYGLFHQRRPGRGSRWTDVVAYVRWNGVGSPEAAFLLLPDQSGYEASSFQQDTATGSPLGGCAVAQARVAYHERLAAWGTETP